MSSADKQITLEEVKSRKLGLALSCGAARGFAHLGVLEVLHEHSIIPWCIAGTSAGALSGAVYCAGKFKEFTRRMEEWTWKDTLRMLDPVILKSGLVDGRKFMDFYSDFLTKENIEECSPKLAVVATDAVTGEELVFREGELRSAVRASISIPGFFTPCPFDSRLLLDGGMVNPMPVDLCREMGAEIILGVNVNIVRLQQKCELGEQEQEEKKEVSSWLSGLQKKQPFFGKLLDFWFTGNKEKETPDVSFADVLFNSVQIMLQSLQQSKLEKDPPDLLMSPEVECLRLMDFHLAHEAIEAGRTSAKKWLEEME